MEIFEELDRLQHASVEPINVDDVADIQIVRLSGETSAERLDSLLGGSRYGENQKN